VGITGLQGSGRTAVARALFGAPPADGGEIRLDGESILIRRPADAIANRIGYVPEERQTLGLFDDLDVKSNLGILRRHSLSRLGLLSRVRLRELAFRMQNKLQIKFPGLESRISSLSGGNQQKVLIGRWLLLEPEVLVMNEPTSGVDVGSKNEICRLIRSLAAEGYSFVISSSDLDELMQLADRILVMNSGRITARFSRGATQKKDLIHAVGAAIPSET
jgi:ABC-type sugar transport system ATPase subunit